MGYSKHGETLSKIRLLSEIGTYFPRRDISLIHKDMKIFWKYYFKVASYTCENILKKFCMVAYSTPAPYNFKEYTELFEKSFPAYCVNIEYGFLGEIKKYRNKIISYSETQLIYFF